jgi:hypothetical protein
VAVGTERDRYIEWLRARGASDDDIAAHRVYAETILACVDDGPVQPADVDEAIEGERAAGAPENRLGNLRRVGDYLQQFQRESPPSAPPEPELDTADFRPPKPEIDTADIQLAPLPRPAPAAVFRSAGRDDVAPRPRPGPRNRSGFRAGAIVVALAVAIIAAVGALFLSR